MVDTRVLPAYPDLAIQSGIQGDVIFKILVDRQGKIIQSIPVDGDPLLVATSVEALQNFQFRPYLLNGNPIVVETQIGFRFRVKGDKQQGRVEYLTEIPFRPEFRTGFVNDKGVLFLSPRKVSGEEPQLPKELAGKSGSVYLTLTIGIDGKVQDAKVVGGDEPFIQPVVAAVKQFVYEPKLVDGKPSVATIQASYHFGPQR